MTVTSAPAQIGNQQIATELATSRAWWFLGTLLVLRNPEGAPPCPAVMELTIPPGGSPPEHVHEALDDSFYLLDGELVARCGDQTLVARPGSNVVLPHGVGHTFRVTSRVPARLLLVHADDSFLRFVQTIGTPASEHRLPPPGEADLDFDALSRASAEHGAPMVGPSLDEDEARRHLPPESEPTLGAISHIALSVTDLAESERWYRENFDLVRIDGAIAGDGSGHITLLSSTGGWILALSSASTAEIQHVAVGCEDRDALMRWREMLTDRGAAPGTITDAPYGSGFVVRDPDGSELELFAAAPAP